MAHACQEVPPTLLGMSTHGRGTAAVVGALCWCHFKVFAPWSRSVFCLFVHHPQIRLCDGRNQRWLGRKLLFPLVSLRPCPWLKGSGGYRVASVQHRPVLWEKRPCVNVRAVQGLGQEWVAEEGQGPFQQQQEPHRLPLILPFVPALRPRRGAASESQMRSSCPKRRVWKEAAGRNP